MTSYLIDLVLFTALVITSWKTGRMVLELRRLRTEESSFKQSLEESDAAINRAAHAVIMLKTEGLETIAALGQAIADAREILGELDDAVRANELRLAVANDAVRGAEAGMAAPTQENWLNLIESRLASASTVNR